MATLESSNACFIQVAEVAQQIIPAWIEGDDVFFVLSSSTPSYIEGGGIGSSIGAYIYVNAPLYSARSSFISGVAPEFSEPKGSVRLYESKQQYLQIPDVREYDHMDQFSMNVWVKFRKDADLVKHGVVIKPGVLEIWQNVNNNSYTMRIKINGVWETAGTLSVFRNRWHMLSITYSGTVLRFYLDGVAFLSKNVTGTIFENNDPWYLGRYPEVNTYSDIDLAMFQLWNYDLSAIEVQSMYKKPQRESCVKAYIHSDEPSDTSASKNAVIISVLDSTNPLNIRVSKGCAIAVDASVDKKMCFILAGGENTRVFDTQFETDPYTRRSFDQIINIYSGISRINELHRGKVVYPLTRDARKIINIPTRDNPNVNRVQVDAWLMTHFSGEAFNKAYIVVGSAAATIRDAFLNGHSTQITATKTCYVHNQSVSAVQNSYVDGFVALQWTGDIEAYINAYTEKAVVSHNLNISAAHDNLEGNQGAHIKVGEPARSIRDAYVHSEAFEGRSIRAAYVRGGGNVPSTKSMFIDGHEAQNITQHSYVTAVPKLGGFVQAYVHTETPHKGKKFMMVHGNQPTTVSKLAHLKADTQVISGKSTYIRGTVNRMYAKRVYLNGAPPLTGRWTRTAFLVNNSPVSTKSAFIVSGPQVKTDCYIVSYGNKSKIKSAHIEA